MNVFTRMKINGTYACVLLIAAMLGSFSAAVVAASTTVQPAATKAEESGTLLFETALKGERSDLADFEHSLGGWELLKNNTIKEMKGFRIQNDAHENLLLVLQTPADLLETALNNNRLALNTLAERIQEFDKIGNIVLQWMTQLSDRISIAEKRITELEKDTSPQGDHLEMRAKLKKLLDLFYEKKSRGEEFIETYTLLFGKVKAAHSELTETRRQLEERLQSQERSQLFERNQQLVTGFGLEPLTLELQQTWGRADSFFRANFWQLQWINVQRSGGITQAILLFLFLAVVFARRKIRKFIQSVEQQLDEKAASKRRLALILFRRSFLLIAATALLWFYDRLQLPHINYHFARFLNQTVFTLLLSQWGIDYLRYGLGESDFGGPLLVKKRIVKLCQLLRVLVITLLFLIALMGSESMSAWLFRLGMEMFLIIWALAFWRGLENRVATADHPGEAARTDVIHHMARVWSYSVFGGALMMDAIGYHALAVHWLVSWAETLALLMWARIGWQSIQEWHHSQKKMPATGGGVPMVAAPVGWLLIQMARLLWLVAILAGVLLAWAGSDFMVATLGKTFNLAFSVGSLNVSVKGILLALIIFYLTHVATRIGRQFLSEKVLDSRNFERGLKDSIVTISSYVIWGVGILLALGILGVNATSLAVVFGALSIGIGFGLQNIFNNFISGLILLFERPIQVGDYVEVNGLWAEVKKINVRSTIVQTFDNATVIIPNSDFISQQVTNWSFKDPRMRRHVDVGVAYGSDIDQVRNTLLEIPVHIPQILKHPQPDVLFLDHGDSALIFRLRYWAHVDHYYSTSTAVRFELDRRFRELGIEIAFPQRDLHIRSDHTRPISGGLEPESSDAPQGEDEVPRQ